jgi:hypothetical protein
MARQQSMPVYQESVEGVCRSPAFHIATRGALSVRRLPIEGLGASLLRPLNGQLGDNVMVSSAELATNVCKYPHAIVRLQGVHDPITPSGQT